MQAFVPDTKRPRSKRPSHRPVERLLDVFSVPLPNWMSPEAIVGISLIGLIAFVVAGFAGYPYPFSPAPLNGLLFAKPTALFLYASLLIVALQVSILRHPCPPREQAGGSAVTRASRRQIALALIATTSAIGIAALIDLKPGIVKGALDYIATLIGLYGIGKLLANAANLWIIGVFAVDSLGRWIKGVSGLIASRHDRPVRERLFTALLGRVANDLVAGSVLIALLAFIFRADVLSFFALLARGDASALLHLFTSRGQAGWPVDDCTVSVYFGKCQQLNPSLPSQFTISHWDWNLALVIFGCALVFLASYLLVRFLQSGRPLGDVLREALPKLRNIRRLLGLAVEALVAPARRVAWPAFVLLGVLAAGLASRYTQLYLHLLSCEHQGGPADLAPHCAPMLFDMSPWNYWYIALAVAFTGLAALSIVVAAVVQLYDRDDPERSLREVAGYWLPALGRIGMLVVIPFGVFSLALCVFNYLLVRSSPPLAVPMSYYPPGIVTYIAFLALVGALGSSYLRRRRRRRAHS